MTDEERLDGERVDPFFNMAALGRFIVQRRQQLGMSQGELYECFSERTGHRSKSTISDLETGRRRSVPSPAFLNALAECLNVRTDDLLREVGYNIAGYDAERPTTAQDVLVTIAVAEDLDAGTKRILREIVNQAISRHK